MANGHDKDQSRQNRAEVRRVLLAHWDPIGAKNEPLAQDEYDMYVEPVYVMLMDDTVSKDDIADYLNDIAANRMGFPRTSAGIEHGRITAGILIGLSQSFRNAEPPCR